MEEKKTTKTIDTDSKVKEQKGRVITAKDIKRRIEEENKREREFDEKACLKWIETAKQRMYNKGKPHCELFTSDESVLNFDYAKWKSIIASDPANEGFEFIPKDASTYVFRLKESVDQKCPSLTSIGGDEWAKSFVCDDDK